MKKINEYSEKGFTTQGNSLKYQKLVKESEYQKTIAVYGKSYKECFQKFEVAEQEWRDSIRLGINTKIGHIKLYEGMLAYLNDHSKINGKKKAIKQSTHATNLRVLNNQIKPYAIANQYADRIKAKALQEHVEQLISAGYSESTVRKVKDLFRAYFYYIYGSPNNPAYEVVIPHIIDAEKACSNIIEWNSILDDCEITEFLAECDKAYIPRHVGTQYADLLKFQFYTYTRISETCALRVKDFVRVGKVGYINIKRNVARANNDWYIDTPKTKSSIRTIKLCKEAQTIIEKRIVGKLPDDLIWTQSNGDFVKYTALERPFKNILKRIGCQKDLSIHSLRHSGISFSLRHGANISAVSKNAGHSSISITQEIYQHVLQSERDEAVDIMEEALNKLKNKNKNQEKVA